MFSLNSTAKFAIAALSSAAISISRQRMIRSIKPLNVCSTMTQYVNLSTTGKRFKRNAWMVALPIPSKQRWSARMTLTMETYLKQHSTADCVYLYLFSTIKDKMPSNTLLESVNISTDSSQTRQLAHAPLADYTIQLYDELYSICCDIGMPNTRLIILTDPLHSYETIQKAVQICSHIYMESAFLDNLTTKTLSKYTLKRREIFEKSIQEQTNDKSISLQTLNSQLPQIPTSNLYLLDELQYLPQYSRIAVGGTFDHFHAGHRKLLAIAALCTSSTGQLLVGVTGDELLIKKKHKEKLDSYSVRESHVHNFLGNIAPHLNVMTQQLHEPMGGAATDPSMQAIVVSDETIAGAEVINDYRRKNSMNALDIIAIPRRFAALQSSTYLRSLES